MARDALDERRLRRLIEVGRRLTSQLDLESILHEVVEAARELTGARYAALGVLAESGEKLERFIYLGIDEETRAAIGELPRGRGVLGELIHDPQPLRLADVSGHPRSYGFPPGHPQMGNFLGVPIRVRGKVYGNLYLTEKQTGAFDDADERAVTVLADWAAIGIDNARLFALSEQERGSLKRAVQGLEAMTEISRAVGGEIERERILEVVAKRTRTLLGARSLLILLREGASLTVSAAAGECGADVLGRRLSIDAGDCAEAPGLERTEDMPSRLRLSTEELGVEASSALLAPMRFRGSTLGMLLAIDRLEDGPEFDAEDSRMLIASATSAAIAVATAQAVTEQRLRQSMTTAERERAHWARELHDSTLQGLGARRVLLASALRLGGEELERAARVVVEELERDIEELRTLITELRPATLDQIGLAAALEDLAERIGTATGVEVRAEISIGEDRLDSELETAAYRVTQEALNNVVKHAEAESASMRVGEAGGWLEVQVSDDGRGFDAVAARSGFGMQGMRERVQLVGGELTVVSEPGSGTRVRAVFPLALDEASGEGVADQLRTGADA